MGVNAHRAFFSTGDRESYLRGLTVDPGQSARLRAARDEIRTSISDGFRDWSELVDRQELFEARALASALFFDAEPSLRPKFRMQGSWSYHTLNCITWDPPQEIDLDDGVFLPVSFLANNGGASPAVASTGYFTVIERILAPLCARKGWQLITDKPSCVRVQIDDDAHVDLALYAIPDDQFEVLLEKAAVAASLRFDSVAFDETVAFADAVYPRLPADRIMLAHRREGWKPSDPRKLEDWFDDALERHGEQLRRQCRYLKGWRDHLWTTCRLSSIALMACVVAAYDEALAAPPENRDDLALQMVAAQLPSLLAGRIPNPVVDGQYLDEGWTSHCRAEFVDGARALRAKVGEALAAGDAATVVAHLRTALGMYLPDDPALITIDTAIGAPAILRSGILKDFADEPEARQAVRKGGDDRYG